MSDSLDAPTSAEPCRICGGELRESFQGLLLGDIPVTYSICSRCESLLLPSPYWLDRAYGEPPAVDPDFGDLRRCAYLHRTIRRMRSLGLLPRRFRSLDFGSGKGVLLRLLLDDGMDAWGFDAYATSAFAGERVLKELPDGPFDLISMVEVIEHTLDPLPALRRLAGRLAPGGVMLVSTELFDARLHGSDWHYLAPELGQHVTIFSATGLRKATEAAGLEWAGSLDFDHRSFVHLMVPKGRSLSPIALLRLRWRNRWREHRVKRDAQA